MFKQKSNDPKGFSLVEIMVAMMIWAVIILGMVTSMIWLSSQSNTQDLRAKANALADQAITIVEGLGETELAAVYGSNSCAKYLRRSGSAYSLTDTPEVLEEIFTRTLQIDPVGWDEAELKFRVNPSSPASGCRVTVTLRWQDSTGEHDISRTSIVF